MSDNTEEYERYTQIAKERYIKVEKQKVTSWQLVFQKSKTKAMISWYLAVVMHFVSIIKRIIQKTKDIELFLTTVNRTTMATLCWWLVPS